jgi:hypothetical protein
MYKYNRQKHNHAQSACFIAFRRQVNGRLVAPVARREDVLCASESTIRTLLIDVVQ